MPIVKYDDRFIDILALAQYFLRKDQPDTSAGKITAPGFDALMQRITSVADAVDPQDAVTLAQLQAATQGKRIRGNIDGYVRVVSTVPYFYDDRNGDGNTVGYTTPQNQYRYVLLEDVTLNSTVYKANSVILNLSGSYVCDNTYNTFNSESAEANPGGDLEDTLYTIKCNALTGHILPNNRDHSEWVDGVYIAWNANYDTTGDNNIGRWEIWGSEGSVPQATKDSPGIVQLGDGLTIVGYIISAAIDTMRGMSFSGTSPNKRFGLNISTDDFGFDGGGALYLKSERVVDFIGAVLADTNSINFTYDDVNDEIKADVKFDSVTIGENASGIFVKAKQPRAEKFNKTLSTGTVTCVLANNVYVGDLTNLREAVEVSINGYTLSSDATLNYYSVSGTGNKTVTLNYTELGIALTTADVIEIKYMELNS